MPAVIKAPKIKLPTIPTTSFQPVKAMALFPLPKAARKPVFCRIIKIAVMTNAEPIII